MKHYYFKIYDSYLDQFKDDTFIYNFGDFSIFQDNDDPFQYWKVYHENVGIWQGALKEDNAGSIYLTGQEADDFIREVISLRNDYDEYHEICIRDTYL